MKLLADAPTQEEQIEYVRCLRMLKAGWTPELRKEYFTWFVKAADYKGGNSFASFLKLIKARRDRVAHRRREGRAQADPRREPGPVKLPRRKRRGRS